MDILRTFPPNLCVFYPSWIKWHTSVAINYWPLCYRSISLPTYSSRLLCVSSILIKKLPNSIKINKIIWLTYPAFFSGQVMHLFLIRLFNDITSLKVRSQLLFNTLFNEGKSKVNSPQLTYTEIPSWHHNNHKNLQ